MTLLGSVRSRERGGWQPIETAPRDGTWIIVWRRCGNDYIRQIGEDHWRDDLGGCWGRSNQDCCPTHWMPLPEPPPEAVEKESFAMELGKLRHP